MSGGAPLGEPSEQATPGVGHMLDLVSGPPGSGGVTVSRPWSSGPVVFLEGALEGARVRARVTRSRPGESFIRARVVEVLDASPARRAHPWPDADPLTGWVGGAELGHATPPEQRRIKAHAANDALERIGRVSRADRLALEEVFPTAAREVRIPSGSAGSRTRVAFAVDDDGRLGMHPSGARDPRPVRDMPLAVDALRPPALFSCRLRGLERVELAAAGGRVLALLVPEAAHRPVRGSHRPHSRRPAHPGEAELLAMARSVSQVFADDGRECAVAAWWPRRGRLLPLIGEPRLVEEVEHEPGRRRRYTVTGDGFWQIHEGAPETLSRAAMDALDPRGGERLADLYAGAGLFTGAMLERIAARGEAPGRIHSIEAYPVTSADAAETFAAEPSVTVLQAKVETALAQMLRAGEQLDRVLLDPSRSGAGRDAVNAIADLGPRVVAYVSCDAGSFARDARYFIDRGYRLERRELYDLYPDTHHVETVSRFVLEAGR